MKEILFLINPVSGGRTAPTMFSRIRSALQQMGVLDRCVVEYTTYEKTGGIGNVVEGYELVIVVGGDGTFHQVLQVVVRRDEKPILGIIPFGTGNDLARSLGILQFFKSFGLKALLEVFLKEKTELLDVLSLNDHTYFTNYFGIGNDAKISNDFNKLRLTRFFPGRNIGFCYEFIYAMLALRSGWYRMAFDIELTYRGGESSRAQGLQGTYQVLISNLASYAGGSWISSKSKMNDGRFEVTVITRPWQWLVMHFTRFLKRPLDTLYPGLVQFQTDLVKIRFDGNTYYQVDGELMSGLSEGRKCILIKTTSSLKMLVPGK